jgi:hypothetical protein
MDNVYTVMVLCTYFFFKSSPVDIIFDGIRVTVKYCVCYCVCYFNHKVLAFLPPNSPFENKRFFIYIYN